MAPGPIGYVVGVLAVTGAVACSEAPATRGERSPTPPPSNLTCKPPLAPVPQGLSGLPGRLSETGCFEASDPTKPLPALIAYTVNAPLWADGADKDRWLALPDGATVTVGSDGDLDLPPGTVLIKTFRFGARRIETRFFVRHTDGAWSGYTYEWNEAGTDAVLLPEGPHVRTVAGQDWGFPSRAECGQCHTAAAGGSLGLELAQLDREVVGPEGRPIDQLSALAARGLFATPLPAARTALPAPDDARQPLEARARAYLHANCANCHRADVDNAGSVDLRFSIPLAATKACGERPTKGTHGFGSGVRLLAPGAPEQSMLVLRMRLLGAGRMPEVASKVIDAAGVELISAWIRGLPGCP